MKRKQIKQQGEHPTKLTRVREGLGIVKNGLGILWLLLHWH
jgi:hypothetical protein